MPSVRKEGKQIYSRKVQRDAPPEEAYREDDNYALCKCGGQLYFDKGVYVCHPFGHRYTREEFFCLINAEHTKKECLTCGENYPDCRLLCKI